MSACARCGWGFVDWLHSTSTRSPNSHPFVTTDEMSRFTGWAPRDGGGFAQSDASKERESWVMKRMDEGWGKAAIARALGVNHSRITQIEARALRKRRAKESSATIVDR